MEIEISIGKAWGKALAHNKHLIHLDLSYNSFGIDTCKVMGKKVRKNHTLFGLHMAGNACSVDTHGFIIVEDENQDSQTKKDQLRQTATSLALEKKQSVNNKRQAQSQSRQQNQRKKATASEIIMKSPQKEILFKRMEGMKAVIKKRNQSIGISPLKRSNPMGSINSNSGLPSQRDNKDQLKSMLQSVTDMGTSISSSNGQYQSQAGQALQKFKVKDNCWICEGWSEFKFELRVPQHIGAEVYLHFDFDDYKPDLMVSTSAGIYQCYRMVPPGTHHYFMSVNGSEFYATGHQSINILEHEFTHIDNKLKKNFADKYLQPFNLQKINFVESQFQMDQTSIIPSQNLSMKYSSAGSSQYRTQTPRQVKQISHSSTANASAYSMEAYTIQRIKNCVPRPDKKFLTQKLERPRTPWTFPISIFKDYKPETAVLINDCFEFDWQCLKKPKMKKSTEDELKEKCKEIYPFIREVYKRLAALGIVGTIFSIGWNVYREFMIQGLNITDKEKLKPDDCDRLFIGVNAGNLRKAPFIPEKALVRFQFLEIMIRIALKRYFESGDIETEVLAIDEFIKNNLNPLQIQSDLSNPYMYNQHKWRVQRYWNEPCDNIYKAFAPLFTFLYNTFGGTHKKPGQKTFMTLDEFDSLIQTAGLVNDLLNQRDIALHFNFAMMCQINEIDYERHFQATYIEFLEAFARASDQASIIIYSPFNSKNNNSNGQEADNNQNAAADNNQDFLMTEEERQQMPLHIKIENAIQYLLKNCVPQKGFLDKFEMPKKHPQVGLYILPNKKFF